MYSKLAYEQMEIVEKVKLSLWEAVLVAWVDGFLQEYHGLWVDVRSLNSELKSAKDAFLPL